MSSLACACACACGAVAVVALRTLAPDGRSHLYRPTCDRCAGREPWPARVPLLEVIWPAPVEDSSSTPE